MTTIGKAIKDAGIAIPTNKRIWQWLKDQGKPRTSAEIGHALNLKASISSSILSQMQVRRMVAGDKQFSNHVGRSVTYYTAIGKSFVVLPVPKDLAVLPASKTPITDEIIDVEPKQSKTDALLSTLSVVDAYDLYQRLHAMFNPKEK